MGFSPDHLYNNLPLLMAFVPMLMAFPVYSVTAKHGRAGGYLAVAIAFVSAAMGIALFLNPATPGEVALRIMNYGISLRADNFSLGIAVFAGFSWAVAMLFSLDYMRHGERLARYWTFMLFTMGATLGVFLAGDLFTLFVFFELMTFSSYVLVVHEENPESLAAGRTFLYMGVLGGLCLLFAIIILTHVAGMGLEHSIVSQVLSSGYFPLVTALFLVGFGIKAGMVPLHVWLPQAHPVAPAPASAVLSGVLIKAGAYGIIRIFLVVLAPEGHGQLLPTLVQNGMILLALGIITILVGGFMALFQTNAKRILAYSSISQIGYILTAVGVAAILGLEGAMGFGGAFYHMLNHVLFKAVAFLAIGYVYMITHELDIRKLKGLWRSMPVAAFALVVAFGAITGLPGLGGFASKSIIHHALVEAHEITLMPAVLWAERAFVLGSYLTAAYFLRLVSILVGPAEAAVSPRTSFVPSQVALVLLAAPIIAIGMFPAYVLNSVVLPAAQIFGFDYYSLKHLAEVEFFLWYDVRAVLKSLAVGSVIYLVGSRVGLFELRLPPSVSAEALLYRPLIWVAWLGVRAVGFVDRRIVEDFLYGPLGYLAWNFVDKASYVDEGMDKGYYSMVCRAKGVAKSLGDEGQVTAPAKGSAFAFCNLNVAILIQALTLATLVVVLFVAKSYW